MPHVNLLIKEDDLFYYQFSVLNKFKELTHGFSTRKGGTSSSPFSTLNMGLHVNDKKENVLQNRRKMFGSLGFALEESVSVDQVHGNHIVKVLSEDIGKGSLSSASVLAQADGMITNIPGILLSTYYADCVPIYIYDPNTSAIGLAHAGWKGTLLKIATNLVNALQLSFGTKGKDCIAVIGPSIGSCCYEVDANIISSFKDAYPNFSLIVTQEHNSKGKINLWEANRINLQESGLLNQNIYTSRLCTYCSGEYFFSHRRDNGKTGRMAAMIGLRG